MVAPENFECLVCGDRSRPRPVLSDARDRLQGVAGSFNYVRCSACSVIQIEHVPDRLWEDHYSRYGRHGRESLLYRIGRRVFTGACYVRPPGPGRLLDVGCGNGAYLQEMRARGWDVLGYEPDPEQARAVRESTGLAAVSEPGEIPEAAFDLVTVNFVLEHADRPRALLDLVRRSCRPGGRVAISLPDPEGTEARLFGKRWFHLDAPRHLLLPNREQAARMVVEAGLEVEKVRSLPAATGFAGSVTYMVAGVFRALPWYALAVPGMIFSIFVRDGMFMVEARRPQL